MSNFAEVLEEILNFYKYNWDNCPIKNYKMEVFKVANFLPH